ncbi:MAG TPA: 2,3-bisphosphoglycerate-independent phosphoglycerate mutase, partial [Thermoleophilaceae bacterium]|nr:2,3-bisphosphoglycerate-independent phosphoglycerate mutase [Thermoleophilaceae bacterium]
MSYPRVCLVVLDGWGLADPGPGNAIALADTPVFDELWEKHPHTTLTTHGPAVGLPEGQMGNSEVGHLNLGAGAVVKQDLLRIDEAIEDGSFFENEALRAACGTERLHLLGLVSDGGVHSSMDHLRALIELAGREGVRDVFVHAFTDGRDTNPDSGVRHVAEVESWGGSRIATVSGRYYAMDRDNRWERTQLAYDAIVKGEAEFRAEAGEQAVRQAYERGETDEFIKPTLAMGADDSADGRIREDDAAIFFNFRPDRARQLTQKLGEAGIPLTTLTEYHEDWDYPVAFPPARPDVTLASTLAERGKQQLHVAETEKYAHVTYFFNGGEEDPYPGEERCLVDSPRDVPTYDKKPEMSAPAAAQALVEQWREGDFSFGIINFANPDMVGHTGVIEAAVKAVETVDECLGQVVEAVHESGGVCVVTADHGNADNMLEPDGSPNTAHSMNPVPLVIT